MQLKGFLVKDFSPRENLVNEGEKIVFEALKHIPIDGSVKVAIVDQGTSFLVSIVAFSGKKIFSSESVQFKTIVSGRPRNWLINSLGFVLNDLVRQVKGRLGKGGSEIDSETSEILNEPEKNKELIE